MKRTVFWARIFITSTLLLTLIGPLSTPNTAVARMQVEDLLDELLGQTDETLPSPEPSVDPVPSTEPAPSTPPEAPPSEEPAPSTEPVPSTETAPSPPPEAPPR